MANFLGPYWVQLNYTAFAPHTMTIPTKNWNPSGSVGTFDIWSGGTVNALTMVSALVTKLKVLFPATASFDNYLVYKQLLPTDTPTPVASEQFSGQIGTGGATGWAKATEEIFIARTTGFGIAKLQILDCLCDNQFEAVVSPDVAHQDIIDVWFNDIYGWSGRDNFQPNIFLKYTTNMNQALRKAYRMD